MTFAAFYGALLSLVLIYALLSLILSWLQEIIAGTLSLRGKNLVRAVGAMLDREKTLRELLREIRDGSLAGDLPPVATDKGRLVGLVLNHSRIKRLSAEGNRQPSYIPPEEFASALIDTVTRVADGTITNEIDRFFDGAEKIVDKNSWSYRALKVIAETARRKSEETEQGLRSLIESAETWFNGAMERASGWYRRRIQWISLIIGFLLAGFLNVDTIAVFRTVAADTILQQEMQIVGGETIEDIDPEEFVLEDVMKIVAELSNRRIPILWPEEPEWPGVVAIVGWILTALAISQGSTLWFTLLKKMIRGSGVPIPTTEKGSDTAGTPPAGGGASSITGTGTG
jgi:hypothetical protein